jgi:hypothetical protein
MCALYGIPYDSVLLLVRRKVVSVCDSEYWGISVLRNVSTSRCNYTMSRSLVVSAVKLQSNFTHNLNYRYCRHFLGLEFMQRACLPKDEEMVEFWIAYCLENCIGTGDWQCRYIRRNVLTYVVLSEAGKTCLMEGIGCYHRTYVINEVLHKPRSL